MPGYSRAAGAQAVINYKTEAVVDRLKTLTHGRGVDMGQRFSLGQIAQAHETVEAGAFGHVVIDLV